MYILGATGATFTIYALAGIIALIGSSLTVLAHRNLMLMLLLMAATIAGIAALLQ